MKNETGRGWNPTTNLQEVLLNTYKTKATIGTALKLSQPTLNVLLKDERKITFNQLVQISNDSKISLINLIKLKYQQFIDYPLRWMESIGIKMSNYAWNKRWSNRENGTGYKRKN